MLHLNQNKDNEKKLRMYICTKKTKTYIKMTMFPEGGHFRPKSYILNIFLCLHIELFVYRDKYSMKMVKTIQPFFFLVCLCMFIILYVRFKWFSELFDFFIVYGVLIYALTYHEALKQFEVFPNQITQVCINLVAFCVIFANQIYFVHLHIYHVDSFFLFVTYFHDHWIHSIFYLM